MIAKRAYSLVLCSSVLLFVASTARAQYKLETCEDLKISETQYGISVVETATCLNPTKTFAPKGTLRNVNAVYSFPKVPTGAGVTFIVTKNDADGEYVRDRRLRSFAEPHDRVRSLHHQRSGKVLPAPGEPLQQSAGVGRD